MLGPRDFRGVYAIIPTPAKPEAARWDAVDTVDLDETARLVERLIADGVHGLIALGTTGECATLTGAEYEAFVDCVLSTVRRRVPTFIGTSALGTHEVVRRIRFVAGRGGDGTLLGLPMWQPCTTDMALRFYETVAQAFPRFAVMVYANQRAFRFDFNADFWRALPRRAPTAIAAKFANTNRLAEVLAASGGSVHFLPHEMAVYRFLQIAPETTTACWATAASMGPAPALALMEAILAGDRGRAGQIDADIAWANETVKPLIADAQLFASYNIQIEKIRIDAAGYCRAGPVRPPYDLIPEKYAEAARECGRRWAQLVPKYTRARAAQAARK